jgi:hypothetical protein
MSLCFQKVPSCVSLSACQVTQSVNQAAAANRRTFVVEICSRSAMSAKMSSALRCSARAKAAFFSAREGVAHAAACKARLPIRLT